MQITATLNRLHKIVERLKARNGELRNEVLQNSRPINLTLAKGMRKPGIDTELKSSKVVSLLGDIYEVSKTICDIKSQILSKNGELGINSLLIEKQEQQFAKTIVSTIKSLYVQNAPSPMTVVEMLNGLLTANDAKPFNVTMNGIDEVLALRLDGIIKEYDTRINELSDKISDLNREKITVEIPDSLLSVAGVSNVG